MGTLNVDAINDAAGSITALDVTKEIGIWQFVSSASITVVTNLDTEDFTAGYDYLISIRGAIPTTDGVTLECRISQSSTYNTGGVYTDGGSNTATSMELLSAVGNGATEGFSCDLLVFEPAAAAQPKSVILHGSGYWSAVNYMSHHAAGGMFNTNADAIDGVRLFFSSDTWQALGKIYVFRRRLS